MAQRWRGCAHTRRAQEESAQRLREKRFRSPGAYLLRKYVYLCVQEILFRMTVRREMREREGSFFRGTSVRWNVPHTWGKGGAEEEAKRRACATLKF